MVNLTEPHKHHSVPTEIVQIILLCSLRGIQEAFWNADLQAGKWKEGCYTDFEHLLVNFDLLYS